MLVRVKRMTSFIVMCVLTVSCTTLQMNEKKILKKNTKAVKVYKKPIKPMVVVDAKAWHIFSTVLAIYGLSTFKDGSQFATLYINHKVRLKEMEKEMEMQMQMKNRMVRGEKTG